MHLNLDGKMSRQNWDGDISDYPQCNSNGGGDGVTSNDQLTLLVEGNTTRPGYSFSSGSQTGSRNGAYSPSQYESRSFGQTDRDDKTSSDGGSTSDPSDRRSDND